MSRPPWRSAALRRFVTRTAPFAWLLLALAGGRAEAGGRARLGGTLGVALTQRPAAQGVPATPLDAIVQGWTQAPLCQLVDAAALPSGSVRLTPLGPGLTSAQLVDTIQRVKKSPTPYAALARGIRSVQPVGDAVELTLSEPWPELGDVLCHPAFAAPIGPFTQTGATAFRANPAFPRGRPFVDGLAVQVLEPRAAQRALAQDKVQLVLGQGAGDGATPRFATLLAVPPELGSELRAAVDATVERGDLVRFFVGGPAVPYPELQAGAPRPPSVKPPLRAPPLELRLAFDARSADHRAVAERLQVKLQPLGYAVRLTPVDAAALLEARPGELRLLSVALPSAPLVAADLLRALAGAPSAAPLAGLPLVPLYLEALAAQASRRVVRGPRDALGLPKLDDAWLAGEDG